MTITAALDIAGWEGQGYLGSDTESTVPWIVYTTDLAERESAIMQSGVLPSRGAAHPDNAYLFAFACKLTREVKEPKLWRAKIQYKTDGLDDKEANKEFYPDPKNRPSEIDWDTVNYSIIADKTVENYKTKNMTETEKAGSPILNSAKDYYDPPPEKTQFNWVANVTKLIPHTVPNWFLNMPGRVNNSPFVIDGLQVQTGCARLVGARVGKKQRENGYPYRELKLVIEFRRPRSPRFAGEFIPPPFILELLDQGYNKRSLSGVLTRITDSSNPPRPVPQPVPLNGAGGVLTNPALATVKYRCHKIYETDDFSKLPLA